MNPLRVSLSLFLGTFFLACSSSQEAGSTGNTEKNSEERERQEAQEGKAGSSIQKVDQKKWEGRSTDPFQIKAARKKGEVLSAAVRYSGGCEEHEFELWASPHSEKSNPPQKHLFIKHNANGDACRSVIKDTLRFNLSSLEGPVILKLEGHDRRIRHGFE